VTLDRAPDDGVGGVSGADGEVGGALDILTDTFLDDTDVVDAGQTIYIKNDGTMTLTGAVNVTNAGTSTAAITIEGYNSSRGDNPTGTNRPLIAAGANAFEFTGSYWIHKNLRVTTTVTNGYEFESGFGIVQNVASNNSSGTANRHAFYTENSVRLLGCDGQSANGYGVFLDINTCAYGCYFHDCNVTGIVIGSDSITIVSCVIDTCGTGISVGVRSASEVTNSTIYNCTTGISGTTGKDNTFLNNIIDACTTGASWTTEYVTNWFDYNCWDNTTDTSNVTKGDNAVTGDPSMTDPANGDFSIPSSSNCVDAALDAGDYTGVTV
jgi:hypothetical protein